MLPPKHFFIVPAKRLDIRAAQAIGGGEDRLAMKLVIVSPVVELLPDAPAHLKAQIGSDGHIASVKQAVNVAAQQKTVSGLMLATFAIGPDMRGFERRERPFLGDGATAVVAVRHQNAESPLPKARADQLRLTKPGWGLGHAGDVRAVHAVVHGLPQRQSFRVAGVVSLERDDVGRPAGRNRKPVRLVEEERLRQDAATDFKVTAISHIGAAIAGDAGPHLRE